MNENNIESVMHNYAQSTVSSKKQDLQKFHSTQTEPHHSSAPMKRKAILIGLCALTILLFLVSLGFSLQTPPPLWDVEVTEFASFHAGKHQIPADQTQILADCVAKSETTAQKYARAPIPKIPCSDISVYWAHRRDNKNSSVGIMSELTPASGSIRRVSASYFFSGIQNNQEFIAEFGFEKLPNSTTWQEISVSYSNAVETEDGTMYKVYFIDSGFHCCLDIYAPAGSEITELLTAIF